MKKIFGVLFAVLLVFGFSGQALASFDFGGGTDHIHLVAVEETDHAADHDPGAGTVERHYDLGPFGAAAPTFGSSWDTDIYLSDFSAAGGWGDVYIGVYALDNPFSTFPGDNYGVGVADQYASSYSISNAVFNGNYQGGYLGTAYGGTANPLSKDKGADSDAYVQQAGFANGSYGGFVATGGDFNAEERLDQLVYTDGSFGQMAFVLGDGTVAGSDAIAGWFTFSEDVDGSLLVNFNELETAQVPIPASVLLLGSGLLGLFGIKRRRG